MSVSPNIYTAPDVLTFLSGGTASGRSPTLTRNPNRTLCLPLLTSLPSVNVAGSRASIRGCASETATVPQQPAATRTNLHQLAALAPTCAEKKLRRRIAFEVPSRDHVDGPPIFITVSNAYYRLLTPINAQNFHDSNGSSPRSRRREEADPAPASTRIKLIKGKYNQLKPPKILPHNPARNPDLNLWFCVGRRPARTCSELFRPIQSCSDLIFYFRSGNHNVGLQTGSPGSETLTVGHVGPAPLVRGEPNLNGVRFSTSRPSAFGL